MGNGIIGRLMEEVQTLVFPDNIYCICCGNIIDESRSYSLCDHCITHIHWNLDKPRRVEFEGEEISVVKCADYGIYERSIIFALKYDGHKYIARTIADIMYDRLEAMGMMEDFKTQEWLIVPIPLYHKKLRERGYNHAELIARHLERKTGVSMVNLLSRIRNTIPMKGLGPEEREQNVFQSMEVSEFALEKLENMDLKRNILLIDDFYTTGSTGKECGRALRKAGFRGKIMMMAFAAR